MHGHIRAKRPWTREPLITCGERTPGAGERAKGRLSQGRVNVKVERGDKGKEQRMKGADIRNGIISVVWSDMETHQKRKKKRKKS